MMYIVVWVDNDGKLRWDYARNKTLLGSFLDKFAQSHEEQIMKNLDKLYQLIRIFEVDNYETVEITPIIPTIKFTFEQDK